MTRLRHDPDALARAIRRAITRVEFIDIVIDFAKTAKAEKYRRRAAIIALQLLEHGYVL